MILIVRVAADFEAAEELATIRATAVKASTKSCHKLIKEAETDLEAAAKLMA